MPDFSEEQICTELTYAVDAHSKESTPNGFEVSSDRSRSRILPDIHIKSKALPNGNLPSAMDESILIQPEQQQMEIFNGNRSECSQLVSATMPNGNGVANMSQPQRRRRNSFNSKPPICGDIITYPYARSDTISSNTNSKFTLQNGSRSLSMTQPPLIRPNHTPSQTNTNISISCPDGLAHALSEQNLRLQQLVLDHKVQIDRGFNFR